AARSTVRGERELLHRAVEDVLRNALRHAPDGTRIEAEVRLDCGTTTITTRDYGVGVPEESLAEIFEPFSAWAAIAIGPVVAWGSAWPSPAVPCSCTAARSPPGTPIPVC